MNNSYNNIYKTARINAGFKREPAAEELHIDVRTLDKYESVDGKPPDEIVKNMCVLYNNNYLAYEHLKKGMFAEFLPEIKKESVQGATLSMINDFNKVEANLKTIIDIASDGIINDNEKEDWQNSLDKIKDLAGSLMGVIISTTKDGV